MGHFQSRVRRYVRTAKSGAGLVVRGFSRSLFNGSLQEAKPIVLQFPVNDICNSRCVMCNIWHRKRDKEFTIDELRSILADPLFSDLRYVGISGGEPTLRNDLPQIGEALVKALPKLKGVGIITNALRPKIVTERISALADVITSAGLSFVTSVSLDGVGADHDLNRGVEGNFKAAVEVIDALQTAGIPVSIGCTLTPINCYGADDLLMWCEERSIPHEFRMGVDIARVYNEGFSAENPLSSEQLFHLVMFFDKLAHQPTTDYQKQFFYESLVNQLAYNAPRASGCDWQTRGVTLDTRGNVSYCSVKSPILGSALEQSAELIYQNNLPIRQQIIDHDCDGCQHDLVGPIPPREAITRGASMIASPLLTVGKKLASKIAPITHQSIGAITSASIEQVTNWQHVLITGWYGTETAGDKAILGELLHFLNIHAPECKITLTTIEPKVSLQTNREFALATDPSLVDITKAHDPALIESVDAVIIGGGPLEELEEIKYLWRIFSEANRQHKARIIFGCGVGPLFSKRIEQMVADICRMATAGFLRDPESYDYALRLGATASLGCACDPALAYVTRWASTNRFEYASDNLLRIIGLVRANTHEYIPDMDSAQLSAFNRTTTQKYAQILEAVCKAKDAVIELLPMHSIWIGGDDRIFNRMIANEFHNSELVRVERAYLPLDSLLNSISTANAAVAMRYHAHLFCMALGIPFISIDYTGTKGKVYSLIKRIEYTEWSENWRNIDPQRASLRLQELVENREEWSAYLLNRTRSLVDNLQSTYSQVFNITEDTIVV